ncbi:uncharacterized protein LOC131357868 isoform X3 [Hemibagrus wyckioides]|uniref:uncharacterized protein LOC131357868 isoform X3 n=1 Tax=Hemibagrus wyckioides TaxID=337641 RepID=UPI00266C3419|nr:uncharacterized protein LOC131357868 isoform X3 [Hemibagrus wyckioides]
MNNDQFYFWILLLIFSTMYKIQPGRHWVTAQSPTKPPIDQPEKELKVNIGDSASLQCCVAKNVVGMIALFKQPNRQRPQLIVKLFKSARGTFSTEFQIPGVQIEKSSNCFNIIILNITQSDEAMYYCAVTVPYVVFADGTYLKIQGEHVTITSETAKPTLSDNSVVCEPTLHGNNTNMNTQENTVSEMIRSLHWTVIGLGTALGLCALLIFCLTYYILRRRKRDKINASPGTRQEYEEETLNYAALQFSKKKAKAEKRKTGSSDECVYSDVNTTVRYNIVDS